MSLPFFHKDHTDISNHLDFPSEFLNLPASSENCILIVGPDLVRRDAAPSQGYTYPYLERLLKGIVEWCTQNNVIREQDIIYDLHALLHNGALVPLAYRIEEYLAARQVKEQCLRDVLAPYSQVEAIHGWLTRTSFRGYITTSYNTCIETAYAQSQHRRLRKFYQPLLALAVDASRKKQPFILKLYGDLDEPSSIKLGHRLLTGLYAEDVCEQLQRLFSEIPAIFIGFDDADRDLTVLQSLVKDGYLVHQKHSTCVKGKVKCDNLIEISGYAALGPEPLSHNGTLLAVRTPPSDTKATRERVLPILSTPPDTEQDHRKATQQRSKKVIDVVIFYAPEDKGYKDGIVKVLNGLKIKEGKPYEIEYMSWAMGESLGYMTDRNDPLLSKQLVILLISLSFLGSDCYDKEHMRKVVNRHRQGAWISPILVSTCDWQGRQFDSLEKYILPRDKVPISDWKSRAKAYFDISKGLEYALDSLACC